MLKIWKNKKFQRCLGWFYLALFVSALIWGRLLLFNMPDPWRFILSMGIIIGLPYLSYRSFKNGDHKSWLERPIPPRTKRILDALFLHNQRYRLRNNETLEKILGYGYLAGIGSLLVGYFLNSELLTILAFVLLLLPIAWSLLIGEKEPRRWTDGL